MAAHTTSELSKLFCLILLFLSGQDVYSYDNRVSDKMYESIQGDMACFKRFNGTHEIGCTSDIKGNVGVIQVVNSIDEVDSLISNGTHHPYVIAIDPSLLTPNVLENVQKSDGKINGVIVLNKEDTEVSHFSSQATCPNSLTSFYRYSRKYKDYCEKKPWNPLGNSILFNNYNFPIFLIDDADSIKNIINCYNTHNNPDNSVDYPLCAIELVSDMFGTTNSEVCMRRALLSSIVHPVNFCDPLYDFNIWGSLKPMNHSEGIANDSVIIVATRTDSITMFNDISPGANSAVTGLVTLLLVAEAINKVRDTLIENSNDKNIMFVLFEGESWDYIGSSRMVWEMARDEFPNRVIKDQEDQIAQISLDHIHSFIELSQVGLVDIDKPTYYLHTDPISNSDDEILKKTNVLIDSLKKISVDYPKVNYGDTDQDATLPPASFQSFLKRKNISGVVITDHKTEFKNKYYDSYLDDYKYLEYKSSINETDDNDKLHHKIANLATSISKLLVKLLGVDEDIQIEADTKLSNDLLHCYLRNINCTIFREHGRHELREKWFQQRPAKMYVSILRGEDQLTHLTRNIFAHYFGMIDNVTESECRSNSTQIYHHYYFPYIDNGTCILSTVRENVAYSPAFVIKDYDWKSGHYSTWTESGWSAMRARIFLIPSSNEEISLVVVGVIIMISSCLLTYLFDSKADLVFTPSTSPAPC